MTPTSDELINFAVVLIQIQFSILFTSSTIVYISSTAKLFLNMRRTLKEQVACLLEKVVIFIRIVQSLISKNLVARTIENITNF